MAHFRYIGKNRAGERVEGVVEAPDRAAAVRRIEAMGHVPLSVSETTRTFTQPGLEEKKKSRFRFEWGFHRKPRMKRRELLLFSRELADLVASGMTIGRALHTLAARKNEGPAQQIIETLRDEIIQGASLSDALELYPETFSTLYINLVRAGEASGNLPSALEHICYHYERLIEARSKVIGAMVYPAIVMTFGGLATIGLMLFVVPRFAGTFAEMGATLPRPTLMLMALSNFLIHYGFFVLLATVGLLLLFRQWIRQENGRRRWHRIVLRLPLAGRIIATNAYAQFARTLGTLLENGVPMLSALSIVQRTIGNVAIAEEIGMARERVIDGSSLSGPLAQGKLFPRLLIDMLAVGEETGNLTGAMEHIARRYDSELNRIIQTTTTVLEPLLILMVAAVIGSIVIALLMPVLTLTDILNA